MLNPTRSWWMIAAVVALLPACGEEDDCRPDPAYDPVIDPARFVAVVDNPLFPLTPGTLTTFAGGDETIEVRVTHDTRLILGVTCTVVRDTVTEGGTLIEDTYDWFAQDAEGNVWYMGEDTVEYEAGQPVSTAGSWEAGQDGAKPGRIMLASPQVGDRYRQEYYACEAEDEGEVLAVGESVTVPQGSHTGCVRTLDTTPLEPDVQEHKTYCPGVGVVLEVDLETGTRTELTSIGTF
jgi:hypothetical protein